MRFSIGKRLTLIPNKIVPVRGDGIHLVLKEQWQERGREVHGEDLVCGSGMLGQGEDGRNADSQVESTHVVDSCVLNQLPDLLGLQMLELVVVGSPKVGDEAPVVVRNDDGAFSSCDGGFDAVFGPHAAEVAARGNELGCIGVGADTAGVDDRFRGEDVLEWGVSTWYGLGPMLAYLCAAGSVLGGSTGDISGR